ncbi:nucleoside hydrolase [Actinotalea sp. M2MS4P-6]|uniref:nucleoside hydrolase n=1 Tax=Actinotalea sp. M2MS4P-6 TaxID=2983762 RepID=UPI0021E46744|nr:nucleoside hydrolase [Actinotalea sp. M2MS4P-6]MCV2393255.1 nucleoside hydrolase [Actinotalea sp. M2MS4P-6]
MTAKKIILDTDPGVGIPGTDADDPIAILLALAHPGVELVGVTTTFGNCPPALSARGAAAVLLAAGRPDIPVVPGSPEPLDGELAEVLVQAYAGARGREGRIPLPATPEVDRDAADFIIDTARSAPGEITVVAIGPQTNLATALRRDPALAGYLAGVVFMGGGLGIEPTFGRGNITPVAECNIYFDPVAADIVMRSGVDLTMVSLDVTNPATGLLLTEDVIRTVDPDESAVGRIFADISSTYLEAPMFDWGHGCVLYDPLAVLAAADPSVGTYEDMAIAIETLGEHTRGQTVPLRDAPPNVHVMVTVDGTAAVREVVDQIRRLSVETATAGKKDSRE